ncbi:peptidoglycan-binding domain-containing protein [Aliiroseovarius sp. PTFE2010]|uniref:peptidoglycan-binding domain-containing protein n=1 Tax=Aliiroseovarius sp. PTFE2010 TaxID=3417190 RepID=UPI003CECDEC8
MHFTKLMMTAAIGTAMTLGQSAPARADGSAVAAGIIGGIVGGAIMADQNKKKTYYKKSYRPSVPATQQGREIQTSLNYFGFNAGRVDGQIGSGTRASISRFQAHMGYPVTGYLSEYEKSFLFSSYHRAVAGGPAVSQMIAQRGGVQGLLHGFRDQAAGGTGTYAAVTPQPMTPMGGQMAMVTVTPPAAAAAPAAPMPAPVEVAASDPEPPKAGGLPSFMASGQASGASLNSHCNKISLLTNTNGGFTTVSSMSDPDFVLSEQLCLARTYAITTGEAMVAKLPSVTPDQVVQQCAGFGPAMKPYVSALSLEPRDAVLRQVSEFVLTSGMSPAELSGTAKICLSAGYRTDDIDVAVGSALLLVALGDKVYGELMGHHLSQGFGASKRADLAAGWYEIALDALDAGAPAAFAPGQPERPALLRAAALGGTPDLPKLEKAAGTAAAPLPSFEIQQ